jgi:hypothetical protein
MLFVFAKVAIMGGFEIGEAAIISIIMNLFLEKAVQCNALYIL